MRLTSPLFELTVIDCMAHDRAPTVQELFDVAERIWTEGAPGRSAFSWCRLGVTDPDKLMALRAAQAALLGSAWFDLSRDQTKFDSSVPDNALWTAELRREIRQPFASP